jgi:hypothetical protein
VRLYVRKTTNLPNLMFWKSIGKYKNNKPGDDAGFIVGGMGL